MDSDQDSVEDWVVLPSGSSSSDDDHVIALSSGLNTPNSASASGTDSDPDADDLLLLLPTANAFAAFESDDAEQDAYALSDAEDTDASPPPSAPLTKLRVSSTTRSAGPSPTPPSTPFPPPPRARATTPSSSSSTFASFFDEPVTALASTRGLVCLRGAYTGAHYVANPTTFERERLPLPARDNLAHGVPAVVIAFDLDPRDGDEEERAEDADSRGLLPPLPRRRRVPRRARRLRLGVEHRRRGRPRRERPACLSGFGALGCAFWRTTMGFFLCYEPVSRCADLVPAPAEVVQWPYWELGEMEGTLCATCMNDGVDAVVIIRLDFARRNGNGAISWTLAGHFEGGCLRGRQDVTLLRSQGKAEVVMWDPTSETVVAMDLEGRTTRTITFVPGSGYYADFIPYVSSLAAVSSFGKRAHAELRTAATNNAGVNYSAMAIDAAAY